MEQNEGFSLDAFVHSPTVEELLALRKEELMMVVDHYEIASVKRYMRKSEMISKIVQDLVDEEILPATVVEIEKSEKKSDKDWSLDNEVRLRELDLEMSKVDLEREKLALEREKVRRVNKSPENDGSNFHRSFDVTKHVKMVPTFQEEEVDKYFLHFEQVAESMQWPVDKWAHLLQSQLKGKARDAYTALSRDEASDYRIVKNAVLQAYALVPEAYRQKFRNTRRNDAQTHREFAKEKEMLFDRWYASEEVGDFDSLRELILVEEFKRCLRQDVRTHLEERKVRSLSQAATMADDYVLTHRNVNRNTNYSRDRISHGENSPSNKIGNEKPNYNADSLKGTRPFTCFNCQKPGHVRAKSPMLQKPKSDAKPFPNMLVKIGFRNVNEEIENSVIKSADTAKVHEQYEPFISVGYVSLPGCDEARKVKVLRDTGASQSLIVDDVLPFDANASGTSVLLQGLGEGFLEVPLHEVELKSDVVSGNFRFGVRPSLLVKGVSVLLGNDLAGDKVLPSPVVSSSPCVDVETDRLEEELPHVFPACAVTRAMARKLAESEKETNELDVDLSDSFFCRLVDDAGSDLFTNVKKNAQTCQDDGTSQKHDPVAMNKATLMELQATDPDIISLSATALSEDEASTVPVCYYKKTGVLMRKWRPPDVPADETWREVHQIVVPQKYRHDIIGIAHEAPLSGHLGVHKTQEKILSHFYCPGMRMEVAQFCKSCHACQIVGKPNQKIPAAPLKPIPAFDEPFSRIIVDCVGPMPKTKAGHEYLLTIMCAATRYPEAIPLRRITAANVTKALVKFFTTVGMPKVVQSDQGSNFMSKVFNQVLQELGIEHVHSSAYHPESQGALERFHQTLKNMLKTYCFEREKEWDEGVPLLLFAARESVQESLGFSPFELVYGHSVRGPLKLLKERLMLDSPEVNMLDYVAMFRERLYKACSVAKENLMSAQRKMKTWYDRKSKERSFEVGDQVLVLLPIIGHPLQARFSGPYTIVKRMGDVYYVVNTPDRQKKKRLCHVNMLKAYVKRNQGARVEHVACAVEAESNEQQREELSEDDRQTPSVKLKNSDVISQLDEKLCHLSAREKDDLQEIIREYPQLFSNIPGRTDVVEHDVDVGDAIPIKQHPYRANPVKMKHLCNEVEYMLENNIVEPSQSAWSSPCVLVPKPDKSYRFCTDYRKVNAVTKNDSYPIPRIDDLIDRIGRSMYVSKLDMLKGYWQIPLTEQAKEISAFVTPMGLFQYTVMPFGMKNAPATYQRMVNDLTAGLDGCEAYIDDVVVFSETWQDHLTRLRSLFERLSAAKLTVNLVKSEFGCAEVQFLGHVVGCGKVEPVSAKVEAVQNFPPPQNKKELMRFLGMAGYYRRFCQNFSDVVTPLTDLLRKGAEFRWSSDCNGAFNKIKAILSSGPVLTAPDFSKPFNLAVDASDVGAGAVLTQTDVNEVELPVCYFSKKFSGSQVNYSTVEKETLALILALQHFEVYVGGSSRPIHVWTDHNPLTFIAKMKNKNQRLLRWSLILQEYILDIRHIRGRDNVLADALSRIC